MKLEEGWFLRQARMASVHVRLNGIISNALNKVPKDIRDQGEKEILEYVKTLLFQELKK